MRAQFCECAMRGSLAPHPTRLRSPSTTEGSGCPVIVPNAGIFGPATRSCPFEVPICEYAMRGSLALHYARLTSSRTKQALPFAISVSKREIAHVHTPECPFWRNYVSELRRTAAFLVHLYRHAPNAHPTPRSACQNREQSPAYASTPEKSVFGET